MWLYLLKVVYKKLTYLHIEVHHDMKKAWAQDWPMTFRIKKYLRHLSRRKDPQLTEPTNHCYSLQTRFFPLLRSWASSAFWRTVDTAREERWLNTSLRRPCSYSSGNHFRKAPGTLSSSTLSMILFWRNHFRLKPLCVGTSFQLVSSS